MFQAQGRLEREKTLTQGLLRDVTSMRQERLTWLENLAHFLRHELKNQMVAMGTSIELAKDGDSLEANRIYLDRAQRSLNRMRGLVSSATEATEGVDSSALVADRVLACQQQHPSRQLVLNLKPGLFVEGNESRISQLIDKLLNNALEHSHSDTEIGVALRRDGDDWVEISVENEGDALFEDRERIFDAFVSTRSRPENLGIGLFVARSIAGNHGGSLVAEDLPHAPGARFVVRLPKAHERTTVASGEGPLAESAATSVSERKVKSDPAA